MSTENENKTKLGDKGVPAIYALVWIILLAFVASLVWYFMTTGAQS